MTPAKFSTAMSDEIEKLKISVQASLPPISSTSEHGASSCEAEDVQLAAGSQVDLPLRSGIYPPSLRFLGCALRGTPPLLRRVNIGW